MLITIRSGTLIYQITVAITLFGVISTSGSSHLDGKPGRREVKYLFEMVRRPAESKSSSSSSSSSEESSSSDATLAYEGRRKDALSPPFPLNLKQPSPTARFQNELEHDMKTKSLFDLGSDLDDEDIIDNYNDKETYLGDEPLLSPSIARLPAKSSYPTTIDHSKGILEEQSDNKADVRGTSENIINRSTLSRKLQPASNAIGSSDGDEHRKSENVSAVKESLLSSNKDDDGGVRVGGTSAGAGTVEVQNHEEKLLLHKLMTGYERDVRPVLNASKPVLIRVGITLTQIFDMDEKNQVLTTSVWLDQEWKDDLLTWDPKDFGGLEMIRIPCERIWLPDIVLYNNADDYTRGYMQSKAMVSYDGNVFWPPPTKFRSTCSVDVTFFPFDLQTCSLKLGSWTYNGFQVDVTNRTSGVDLSNYISNGEWELLQAVQQRNVVHYSCCPEFFPDVTITIVIKRKTLYYIHNVILPCIMLSSLTLLVFCLPPDSGEKIGLGITVLLSFSVFMLAINESLPETSESIPLIGVYLTIVMAITSVSVMMTVVVLNLHYLGPKVRPVPRWLMHLLPKDTGHYRIRQKSLMIPVGHREPKSGSLKRAHVFFTQSRRTRSEGYSIEVPREKLEDNMATTIEAASEDSETLTNDNSGNCSHNVRRRVTPSGDMKVPLPGNILETQQQRHSGSDCGREDDDKVVVASPSTTKLFEELLISLRLLISKQEEVEAQNNLVAEWRLVAQVVDRILFWLFFTFTFVSSMLILVVLPIYNQESPLLDVNGTNII